MHDRTADGKRNLKSKKPKLTQGLPYCNYPSEQPQQRGEDDDQRNSQGINSDGFSEDQIMLV
jgi:hypothetical protein